MFNGFTKALSIVILGLCLGLWIQYQKISSLKAENDAQAQIIKQQSVTISKLNDDIQLNQKLALEVSQKESEMRSKSDDVIQSIPMREKQSEPFNTPAPKSIIDFLRE